MPPLKAFPGNFQRKQPQSPPKRRVAGPERPFEKESAELQNLRANGTNAFDLCSPRDMTMV